VLGEFGDDPDRYAGARARKNYAGSAPITRASGKKTVVLARFVRNQRLAGPLQWQAFCALRASPGARAHHDQLRARGAGPQAALRQLSNGWSGSCTAASRPALPTTSRPPGATTNGKINRLPLDIRRHGMSDDFTNPWVSAWCIQFCRQDSEMEVVDGAVEHRDSILWAVERTAGRRIVTCVSTAAGRLVLDL
jgi:hypothetical protein